MTSVAASFFASVAMPAPQGGGAIDLSATDAFGAMLAVVPSVGVLPAVAPSADATLPTTTIATLLASTADPVVATSTAIAPPAPPVAPATEATRPAVAPTDAPLTAPAPPTQATVAGPRDASASTAAQPPRIAPSPANAVEPPLPADIPERTAPVTASPVVTVASPGTATTVRAAPVRRAAAMEAPEVPTPVAATEAPKVPATVAATEAPKVPAPVAAPALKVADNAEPAPTDTPATDAVDRDERATSARPETPPTDAPAPVIAPPPVPDPTTLIAPAVALTAPPAVATEPTAVAAREPDRTVAATSSDTRGAPVADARPAAPDPRMTSTGDRGGETPNRGDDGASPRPARAPIDAAPTATTPRDGAPLFTPTPAPPAAPPPVPEHQAATGVIVAQPARIGQDMGVAIAHHVAAGGATGGGETITLRLDPVDMGRIEVNLSFDDGGTLRAVVSADNPAALEMLRRDSADLGRALTDAGVRADAQTLRFDTRSGAGGGSSSGDQQRQQPADPRSGATPDALADIIEDVTAAYRPLRTRGRVDLVA